MFCLPLQDKRKVWKITLALCLPNHFFVIAAKDSTTSDPVDKVEFKSPGSRILGAGKNIYLRNLVGYYIVHDPFWRTKTSLRRLVLESPCIHRPIYIQITISADGLLLILQSFFLFFSEQMQLFSWKIVSLSTKSRI